MSFVSFVFACLQLCTLLSSFVWNLLKSLPVRNRNNHTCILNVCYHTCIVLVLWAAQSTTASVEFQIRSRVSMVFACLEPA